MTTKSKARGTATERMAVRHLQATWPEAERRALAGKFDKGDIVNVPFTTIEVKGERANRLPEWKFETLTEQRNNGDPFCLLISRRDYQPVGKWDAWMPASQLSDWAPEDIWTRMDLDDAVRVLQMLQRAYSVRSSLTTESTMSRVISVSSHSSARSTESDARRSA